MKIKTMPENIKTWYWNRIRKRYLNHTLESLTCNWYSPVSQDIIVNTSILALEYLVNLCLDMQGHGMCTSAIITGIDTVINRKDYTATIYIKCGRPGWIIGKGGKNIDQLRDTLKQKTGLRDIHIELIEDTTTDLLTNDYPISDGYLF